MGCVFLKKKSLLRDCFCFSDISSASFMVDILSSSIMGEEGVVKPLGGSEVRNEQMIIDARFDLSWQTFVLGEVGTVA